MEKHKNKININTIIVALLCECVYSQQHVGGGRSQPRPALVLVSRFRELILSVRSSQGRGVQVFGLLAMADPKQGGDRGEDECVNAFKRGNKHVAEQLLPHTRPAAGVDSRDRELILPVSMVSLLHLTTYWGWTDIGAVLVTAYGCAANCGRFPLHYAAINGQLDMVKYLVVEQHCDPMDKNKYNETPLHYACINGHLNIVQYLISELHCNPSCVDNSG